MTITEARRRIQAACTPEREWLKRHAQDDLDHARTLGYEDGVRDALAALSEPARPLAP